MSEAPSERIRAVQLNDELLRLRAFLWLSGGLAVVGGVGSFLVPGDARVRWAFLAGVLAMVVAYAAFGLVVRDVSRYSSLRAGAVIAVCNLTGVLACLFYGLWSAAPMVLMLPVSFFGLMRSRSTAVAAYALVAGAAAIAQLAILSGLVDDPGMLSVHALDAPRAWLYAALTHAVYLAAFLFARASHRASTRALVEAEQMARDWERDEAVLREVQQQLDEARGALARGALTGSHLGGWLLGGVLGRGASGEVYDCAKGGQRGAVKVLRVVDERERGLLLREAGLVRRLSSPHIVRLLDVVTDDAIGLVMERLQGEELSRRLRRVRRLPAEEVLELARQVAEGLEVARAAGVVHRDIKPSNLFSALEGEREVWKILDFGISKLEGQDATLTRGIVMGTPGYMAPEQARGSAVDHRSDVFSLAAVCYRTLTGAPPFRGDSEAWQLSLLYDQPQRPSRWLPLPPEVDLVLALGLAKEPAMRFESALAFAQALREALAGRMSQRDRHFAAQVLRQHGWGQRRVVS